MRKHILRWFGHVKRMDDERAPEKANKLVVDGSKKGSPKKRKKVQEKSMLARGLKRTDALERSVWRLGCKNRFTPASMKNKPGSRKMIFSNTPGTNE